MEQPVNQGTPTPAQPNSGSYSAEYVKELRDEAASWRTKFRETETRLKTLEESAVTQERVTSVKAELSKRNLDIDVDLIKIEPGVKVDVAVDNFLKKYPQFGQPASPEPTRKPMAPHRINTNTPLAPESDVSAVKKDPVAREKLREIYRGMLNAGSNLKI